MDKETIDLLSYFSQLDPTEEFYKSYYEAKKDPESFKHFIDLQNNDNLHNRQIWIPEFDEIKEMYLSESVLFDSLSENIRIAKHCRYSPVVKHSHSFFEIVYVLNGNCKNVIENDVIVMNTGDICFLAPDISHTMSVFDDSLVFNILIRKSMFQETFFKLLSDNNVLSIFFTRILYSNNSNNYCMFHTLGDNQLETQLRYLIWEGTNKSTYYNYLTESLLLSSFGYILCNHADKVILPKAIVSKLPHVATVLQYIQDNYNTVTLNNVAQHFGYTAPYLSNLIRTTTESSFTEILKHIRLNKACNLLVSTNMSICDISLNVGYQNPEHFHRIFKENFTMTPTGYRRVQV